MAQERFDFEGLVPEELTRTRMMQAFREALEQVPEFPPPKDEKQRVAQANVINVLHNAVANNDNALIIRALQIVVQMTKREILDLFLKKIRNEE